MALIEAGASDTLAAGTLDRAELEAMAIPTYIRAPDDFFRAVAGGKLPLTLVRSTIEVARDPAFEAFRDHRDASRYSHEAVAAYRAWSEPALMGALDANRTADERAAVADDLYEHTRARLEASPTECAWHIGLARIRRDARRLDDDRHRLRFHPWRLNDRRRPVPLAGGGSRLGVSGGRAEWGGRGACPAGGRRCGWRAGRRCR
jgi:hypothetical protein